MINNMKPWAKNRIILRGFILINPLLVNAKLKVEK